MDTQQTESVLQAHVFRWLVVCFTLVGAVHAADIFVQGTETGAFWAGLVTIPIAVLAWATLNRRYIARGFERAVYFSGTALLITGLYRTEDWFLANYAVLLTMALAWTTLQQLQDEEPHRLS